MRLTALVPALLLGAALTGCADINVTNPNQQTAGTFWRNQTDALQALNATYNGLQYQGTYGRWTVFAFDIRSDIGVSFSPWGELNQFNKFAIANYDFEVNAVLWGDHYKTIYRANQVIDNVPGINMDVGTKARIVGEAKFIRALLYSNLANLYGNVPLKLNSRDPQDRPPTATVEQVWAQVEKDLNEAIPVLPAVYGGADVGRATKGAAQALLGKVLLQQRKWAEASTQLSTVITSNTYDLIPNYRDNFTDFPAAKNNVESVFEVQMSGYNPDNGLIGLNYGKFMGPPQVGFNDGSPRRWYFDEFFKDSTTTGQADPRAEATFFWNKPDSVGGGNVFGRTFQSRYGAGSNDIFWRKWSAWYKTFQDFDEPINYKVIRFADVLLMYAEAENEKPSPNITNAYTAVNRVRARVGLRPLPAGLDQAGMRAAILHERLLELGLEHSRWLDLKRQNLLTAANLPAVKARDDEFANFQVGKSELLPIPQSEINLNPNARQNPGWGGP
jgi:hypothetical protein